MSKDTDDNQKLAIVTVKMTVLSHARLKVIAGLTGETHQEVLERLLSDSQSQLLGDLGRQYHNPPPSPSPGRRSPTKKSW